MISLIIDSELFEVSDMLILPNKNNIYDIVKLTLNYKIDKFINIKINKLTIINTETYYVYDFYENYIESNKNNLIIKFKYFKDYDDISQVRKLKLNKIYK